MFHRFPGVFLFNTNFEYLMHDEPSSQLTGEEARTLLEYPSRELNPKLTFESCTNTIYPRKP